MRGLPVSPSRGWLRCTHADVEHDASTLHVRWANGNILRISLDQCRGASVVQVEDGTCELVITFAAARNDSGSSWKDHITIGLGVPRSTSHDALEFTEFLNRQLDLPGMAQPAEAGHSAHGAQPAAQPVPPARPAHGGSEAAPDPVALLPTPEELAPRHVGQDRHPGPADRPQEVAAPGDGTAAEPWADREAEPPVFARAPRDQPWVNLVRDRDCADLYAEVLALLRPSG